MEQYSESNLLQTVRVVLDKGSIATAAQQKNILTIIFRRKLQIHPSSSQYNALPQNFNQTQESMPSKWCLRQETLGYPQRIKRLEKSGTGFCLLLEIFQLLENIGLIDFGPEPCIIITKS